MNRQMQALGGITLAVGCAVAIKVIASSDGPALGLSAAETTLLVGLAATVLFAAMSRRSA